MFWREKLSLLSKPKISPPNPWVSGGSPLHHGGSYPLRHRGSHPLHHGGSSPPHRLGFFSVFLHSRSLNHTVTHSQITTKTPPLSSPPLPAATVASNQHTLNQDGRQIQDQVYVLLFHHGCFRAVTVASSSITTAPSPNPPPPPEPPPLPQLFDVTETRPTADLTQDRPVPKPPWSFRSSPLAIWSHFKIYVFIFVDPYFPYGLLPCSVQIGLLALCFVVLSVAYIMVALRVFNEMSLHFWISGTGLLEPNTIGTITNLSFLSASQLISTHEMILAIIETIYYSRNVLARVKEMIRNWMGLKTEGPFAIVLVWMKLVWLLGWCWFVYQELLMIKERKVRATIIINLLFFYDGHVNPILVFKVDQSETCYSRFVLALIQKMIRNWIDSKTVVSSSYLASNNVWKKLALVTGLDVWFDVIFLWPKLLCNDPINLDVQTIRITSKVWIGNALVAYYLSCNLFNFIF